MTAIRDLRFASRCPLRVAGNQITQCETVDPMWQSIDTRRTLRLVLLALGVSLGITAVVALFFWLEDHLSRATLWRARLISLIVLELAYGIMAVALGLALPLLGILVYRRHRRPEKRLAYGRCLLLCVSLLLGIVLAEGTAAVWWKRTHRSSALPIGGWEEADRKELRPRMPEALELAEPRASFPEKADKVIDLVVIGESSAAGVPYDWWLSVGHIVSWQLGELMPGREYRCHVLAKSGDTLEGQYGKLMSMTFRPDVLIIYAGHNEFSAVSLVSRNSSLR